MKSSLHVIWLSFSLSFSYIQAHTDIHSLPTVYILVSHQNNQLKFYSEHTSVLRSGGEAVRWVQYDLTLQTKICLPYMQGTLYPCICICHLRLSKIDS